MKYEGVYKLTLNESRHKVIYEVLLQVHIYAFVSSFLYIAFQKKWKNKKKTLEFCAPKKKCFWVHMGLVKQFSIINAHEFLQMATEAALTFLFNKKSLVRFCVTAVPDAHKSNKLPFIKWYTNTNIIYTYLRCFTPSCKIYF